MKIRPAKVQDVKAMHKIIEFYADNKEMLHRSLNSIYENIQEYVVAENKGVVNIMNGVKYYECFDCPECGCQNIVNIREGLNEK